jgi:hypothetical protein
MCSKYRLGLCANDLKNSNGLWQEPLLKIEINNPALLAGNWSQLCATCKVVYILFWLSLNFLHEALSPAINILHRLSYACPSILYLWFCTQFLCCFFFRLWGLFVQNIVLHVIAVWNNLTIIVLGCPIALARY